jgi:hypothetical protein
MGGAPVKRMPAREISLLVNPRRLARIHDNHPLVVLDRPSIDWQPIGPLRIEKHVRGACDAGSLRLLLGLAHLDEASAYRVNLHALACRRAGAHDG